MGHLKVVKLLKKDADFTMANNNGWTPLHAASWTGHLEVVKLLLENCSSHVVSNNIACTQHHTVPVFGHMDAVEVLPQLGITKQDDHLYPTKTFLNEQDILHRTPLHLAVHQGHDLVLQMLLNYHADLALVDCYGRRVVDWASISESISQHLGVWCHHFHPIPVDDQVNVLRQTVQFICQKNIQSTRLNFFWKLGHCLIYLITERAVIRGRAYFIAFVPLDPPSYESSTRI
jgi:hypothetical protein